MERPGGVLSLALVGMLAGGALIPHFAPGPANAPTRTPDRRAEPAPPDPTDGLGPFVDQMAQLMNVDITEQGLIKETARRLQNRTVNAADAEMVRCFFDLDVDRTAAFNTAAKQFTRPDCGATRGSIVPGLSLPESTVDIVKQTLDLSGSREASDSDKTSQVGTSIRQAAATLSGARKSSGETLREDRAAAARRRMAFITIREAASKAFDDPVKFVVVTMPDPVDSYSGWQFDPMLSALAEAAAASRYTLNRFYFPDSPPTHGNGEQPPGHLHERYPGVVIFRHDYRPNGGKAHSSLLVLLTVYETPTSGVHPRALASALRTVVDWHRGDAPRLTDDEPLLLLGPSFSGSSESIRAELDRVRAELGPIRIVSTATSPDNAFVLNSPPDNYVLESPRDITFKATVRSTRVLRDALWTYLSTVVDPRIDAMPKTDALPVLWLVEANTQYGGYREPISPDAETASIPYGRAIVRRFPMHISRIGVEEAARAPGPGVVSRFRSLAIGDEIRPTDQLPFFSPRTTNSYVELVLANILKTIADERIGFVGMIATDARDKMFLAREIRREAPNVVMFTTENDLFYSHPDYFASTGGMLIAAPYPMGTPLQRVSEAQHFPTSTAHGAYNALIALLNYDTGGNRAKGAAPLLQYSAPDCNANCQPPVWISVVGRDRPREIWRYDTPSDPPSDPYSFGAEPTETWEVGPLAVGRMVPIGFSIVMLLILFQALHVQRDVRSKLFGMMAAFATAIQTCRVLARWLPKGRLARVREIGHGNAADPLTAKQWAPYSLVASVAMLPVIVLIWGFGWLWLSRSLFDPWGWFFSLTGLLTIGALAVARPRRAYRISVPIGAANGGRSASRRSRPSWPYASSYLLSDRGPLPSSSSAAWRIGRTAYRRPFRS